MTKPVSGALQRAGHGRGVDIQKLRDFADGQLLLVMKPQQMLLAGSQFLFSGAAEVAPQPFQLEGVVLGVLAKPHGG